MEEAAVGVDLGADGGDSELWRSAVRGRSSLVLRLAQAAAWRSQELPWWFFWSRARPARREVLSQSR